MKKIRCISSVKRFQACLLAEMSAHHVICIMMNLPQKPILGLKFIRKLLSLDQRRIFPFKLSLKPLLPSFTRVDYWINEFLFFLLKDIRHLTDVFVQNESFKQDLIVYIPIGIFFS